MAWLGLVYIVIFFGVFFGVVKYVFNRRGGVAGAVYRERRRAIETAMHREEYDRQIIDDVAREWGYDARRHYRRPPAA